MNCSVCKRKMGVPIAQTRERATYWCDRCSSTRKIGKAPEETVERTDTGPDFYHPPSPRPKESAAPAHQWFGGDHPVRTALSRSLVDRHLICEQTRSGCVHLSDTLRCDGYPAGPSREDNLPKLRDRAEAAAAKVQWAREALNGLERRPWHSHGLAARDGLYAALMAVEANHGRRRIGGHWNDRKSRQTLADQAAEARQSLRASGYIVIQGYVPTGRPNGRPKRERCLTGMPVSELAFALIVEEIERAAGVAFAEARTSAEFCRAYVQRSPLAASVLAFVLGRNRTTIWRWRRPPRVEMPASDPCAPPLPAMHYQPPNPSVRLYGGRRAGLDALSADVRPHAAADQSPAQIRFERAPQPVRWAAIFARLPHATETPTTSRRGLLTTHTFGSSDAEREAA